MTVWEMGSTDPTTQKKKQLYTMAPFISLCLKSMSMIIFPPQSMARIATSHFIMTVLPLFSSFHFSFSLYGLLRGLWIMRAITKALQINVFPKIFCPMFTVNSWNLIVSLIKKGSPPYPMASTIIMMLGLILLTWPLNQSSSLYPTTASIFINWSLD